MLQAAWRCRHARRHYVECKSAAVTIQASMRGHMSRKVASRERKIRWVVVRLQSILRGRRDRGELQGSLVVTVVRGTELKDREFFKKQSPYVLLKLVAQSSKHPGAAPRDRDSLGQCVCMCAVSVPLTVHSQRA
jgi:hypothetical protein